MLEVNTSNIINCIVERMDTKQLKKNVKGLKSVSY